MIWVTAEDVIALHSRVIEKSGGIDGLRDRALLEAAVAAPLQAFGDTDFYPGIFEKAARLGYGLASNHAFLDGNKRIGALMVQLILKWNGYDLQLQTGELSDAFISIASGTMSEEQLHNWICEHTYK
ncbi:MAG: type II toxin-antitoxin system death-on-curing family toxin [Eubacteriales bacterium]|nr:type II toxin-antitoxin system death-on-curing family toxin [Eubacteriales bacterium]